MPFEEAGNDVLRFFIILTMICPMPLSMRWTLLPALSMLLGSCDDISRSDRPLSRVAAVGMVSSPLPPSARNVYYVISRRWTAVSSIFSALGCG